MKLLRHHITLYFNALSLLGYGLSITIMAVKYFISN